MTSRLPRAQQLMARTVRRAQSSARRRVPQRFRPALRALRPLERLFHRAALKLEQSRPAALEEAARSGLRSNPEDAFRWRDLAVSLEGQARYHEAADAWLHSAIVGDADRVTANFFTKPDAYQHVASDDFVGHLRAVAAEQPRSAHTQLFVGAFLLDIGLLEEGRRVTAEGYRLRLAERGLAPAAQAATDAAPLLPSLLVVGPHKTATTSLFAMVAQHPRFVAPARKELSVLTRSVGRSPDRYAAYFPRIDRSLGLISGEASPSYLASPDIAAFVASHLPEAKVVVLRRDPVARAYSHFQMVGPRYLGDPRTFELAVDHEIKRLGPTPPLDQGDIPARPGSYLYGSCILPHLRTWVDALGPERVMVIDSAALSRNRDRTLAALFDYLDLPPADIADLEDRNVYRYPPMRAETATRLREWFAPHEVALDAYLAAHPARISA